MQRRKRLKARYGITIAEYDAMLAAQGGTCAVCGTAECASGRRFAVDHDHTTGRVRGLVCLFCNRALGLIRDDPALARSLARYLEAQ